MYLWSSSESIKEVLKRLEGHLWIIHSGIFYRLEIPSLITNEQYQELQPHCYIQGERSLTGQASAVAPADCLVAWSTCL